MSRKILHLTSILFLLWIFHCMRFCNAQVICSYYKPNDPTLYNTTCAFACCPKGPSYENYTCCYPSVPKPGAPLTPIPVIIGYQTWLYILCGICLLVALSILVHYVNRICSRKHSKFFNSEVEPSSAFTISKKELDVKPNDSSIIIEQNPPSYSSRASLSTPPPPPYLSIIDATEEKISE